MPLPVLIDTDPGIDDALALLLAFAAPEWQVEAVTTVAGNVPVDVATRNVARILGALGSAAPPLVAVGAAAPRARPLTTATHVHGDDGLAGLSRATHPDGRLRFPEAPLTLYPGDAADLWVESARRWPDALVIVTLGPLTNAARAVDRDADALRRVRAVVVMGGAVAVPGNVTAAAEFNIFVDPESAAHVLAAGLPVTLVPLDVTREVVWSAAAIERLPDVADPVGAFVSAVARAGLALAGSLGEPGITMHDPLAVGVALDPTLVTTARLAVRVETTGCLTRGVTGVDRRPPSRPRDGWPTCDIALGVDAPRFLRLFEERVCRRCA